MTESRSHKEILASDLNEDGEFIDTLTKRACTKHYLWSVFPLSCVCACAHKSLHERTQ